MRAARQSRPLVDEYLPAVREAIARGELLVRLPDEEMRFGSLEELQHAEQMLSLALRHRARADERRRAAAQWSSSDVFAMTFALFSLAQLGLCGTLLYLGADNAMGAGVLALVCGGLAFMAWRDK